MCLLLEGCSHEGPVWSTPLLGISRAEKNTERLFTMQNTLLIGPPRTKTKPGHLRTKKLRVVCGDCNNGWMSALESAAKPTLTALITSQPRVLSPDDLGVLARWVALKVMVAECDVLDLAVTPPEVRKRFKADQQVPSDFRICIGQCGVDGWECGYHRHAATVGKSPLVTPQHQFKNIHSVAIGIGDLFIFAMYTSPAGSVQRRSERFRRARSGLSCKRCLHLAATTAAFRHRGGADCRNSGSDAPRP